MFINIVFKLGCDSPSGLLYFVPALLLSLLTLLFLPSPFVCLSAIIIAVQMHECLGKLAHEFPISYSYTWILGVASKQQSLLCGKVGNSTTLVIP